MRVTVRFVDGEELGGRAERVSLDDGGFTLVGTGGNTRSIWVGTGAIKYVSIHPARSSARAENDPRESGRLAKLVLHFLDGEVLRTYRDQGFKAQAGGFAVRLWDERRGQLVKALVAGNSLKGVFEVKEWDSRSDEERQRQVPGEAVALSPADQALPAEIEPAPPEAHWVEQDRLLDVGPKVAPEAEPAEVPAWVGSAVDEVEEPRLIENLPAPARTLPSEDGRGLVADDQPQLDLVLRGDTEERRATFNSGLLRRRALVQTLTPEEERHLQLRARISEVLGAIGPGETEDDPPA